MVEDHELDNTQEEQKPEPDSDWDENTDWQEWPEGEYDDERRLGRSLPGWVPLAGIAILVVAVGLWWGLNGGKQSPRSTPASPVGASGIQATATVSARPSASGQESNVTPVATTPQSSAPSGPIATGKRVEVTNTGPDGISLRYGGGLNYARITTLAEGTSLTVIDAPPDQDIAYPVQKDGFSWWRVQQEDGTVGWLAENWLRTVSP